MGLPEKSLHGAVRLPLSRETTLEEVDQVVSVLSNIVAQLRANSREHAKPRKYTSRSRKIDLMKLLSRRSLDAGRSQESSRRADRGIRV